VAGLRARGAAIGALMGFFGVGGSSVATPLLAALGLPPLLAVASPLPATIPAALTAARALRPALRGPPAGRRLDAARRASGRDRRLLSRVVGGPPPSQRGSSWSSWACGGFAQRFAGSRIRRALGWFLMLAGIAFTGYRLGR
jgi:hypothetical protein